MEEYISKKGFEERIKSVINDSSCPIHIAATIQQYLDEEPSVDVSPVVHGHWVDKKGNRMKPHPIWVNCPDSIGKSAYCSECGEWLDHSDEYIITGLYCPHCGAKMDDLTTNIKDTKWRTKAPRIGQEVIIETQRGDRLVAVYKGAKNGYFCHFRVGGQAIASYKSKSEVVRWAPIPR